MGRNYETFSYLYAKVISLEDVGAHATFITHTAPATLVFCLASHTLSIPIHDVNTTSLFSNDQCLSVFYITAMMNSCLLYIKVTLAITYLLYHCHCCQARLYKV